MPFAQRDDQRIYWEESRSDGDAVAFSHGFLMDREMFRPQVERFGDDYRCIVWDERGHGQTGDASEPFTYWDSAEDLVAILREAGVERAVLVGMSQGGYLTLRTALAHPEVVRGLILIDTQSGKEPEERMPYYQELVERWTTQGLDDELAGQLEAILLGEGYAGAEPWKERWKRVSVPNLLQIFNTVASREDISDRMGEITAPTLVIQGERDATIPMERAQQLADAIPNAELVVIPDAAHAPNLTHPDAVNPHIERFLASLS